jgi:hypothetical protein
MAVFRVAAVVLRSVCPGALNVALVTLNRNTGISKPIVVQHGMCRIS